MIFYSSFFGLQVLDQTLWPSFILLNHPRVFRISFDDLCSLL